MNEEQTLAQIRGLSKRLEEEELSDDMREGIKKSIARARRDLEAIRNADQDGCAGGACAI